jgi:hypothetical protein
MSDSPIELIDHTVNLSSTDIPAIEEYLGTVMSSFDRTVAASPTQQPADPAQIFDILTHREFCYLSRTKAAPYREQSLALIGEAMQRSQPIPFSYDIGGGYHATPRLGTALSFSVGLAELLVLRQIASFAHNVTAIYAPGVQFLLVIDNLCAYFSNDIPLTNTREYGQSLMALIHRLGLSTIVDVLVESDRISLEEFDREVTGYVCPQHPLQLSEKEHENVARFLGRPCDAREASERAERYTTFLTASERLLAPFIKGVHMTQRATPSTLCFRPFPGGDSRIQCGEVVLAMNGKHRIHPMLITTTNVKDYTYSRYHFSSLVPLQIPYITYAQGSLPTL